MPEKAIGLFKEVQTTDEVLVNLVLTACAKCRTAEALDLVRKVISDMPKSLYSNVFVVTSALDALMKCGDSDAAQSLFDASTKKDQHMYGTMMNGNSVQSDERK